jgi:hypothetical protein
MASPVEADVAASKAGVGWTEINRSGDSRVSTAVDQIRELRSVNPKDYLGVSKRFGPEDAKFYYSETCPSIISLKPTYKEFTGAPEAVQRVFRDLGFKSVEEFSIEITIPTSGANFDFSIVPAEITDDRIGITLSTTKSNGGLFILNNHFYELTETKNAQQPAVEFFPFEQENQYPLIERAAGVNNTRVKFAYYTYAHLNKERSYIGKPANPYMIKIVEALAQWGTTIITERKVA